MMMNHGILGGLIWWVESTENTVVSTSGKKGFLVNLHLPFIQFWDKSPLLEVYFASETMIFVGRPPF